MSSGEVFLSGCFRVTRGDELVTLELLDGEAVRLVSALSRREAMDLACVLLACSAGWPARPIRYGPKLSS